MKRLYNFLMPFVATLVVTTFFYTVTASADGNHDGPQTTAEQAAADKNNEAIIKDFILHAKGHFERVNDDLVERAEFYRQARNEGIWRHDSVYLIMLEKTGSVIHHGTYTDTLYGDNLGKLDTVMSLTRKLENSGGEAVCEPYTYDGAPRQACAVEYEAFQIGDRRQTNIMIGGFDHDPDDGDIGRLDCSDYEPAVTAAEVQERQTRESLKDFVEGAIIRYSDAIDLLMQNRSPERRNEATRIVQCFSKPGHWKSGSIYLFVMTADTTVVINGLNQELAGSQFRNVFDEDGVDIGKEIIDTAGEDGAEGFVEYKWDDPSVDGDEVSEPGKAKGISPKVSYVKGVLFSIPSPQVYIFGSGIYPKDGDDDGCAIAGASSKPGSIVLNMFLIMFSMVLAVSLVSLRRK